MLSSSIARRKTEVSSFQLHRPLVNQIAAPIPVHSPGFYANNGKYPCAMIRPMALRSSIFLDTRILDLPADIARLGSQGARKLALGLAEISPGKDINTVTVEDLLLYLPMRYEDRSRMMTVRDLQDDQEASLDLTVRLARARYIGRQRFIFTVSASEQGN